LQWSVSKFRVSADIEGVLDQAIAQMQQAGVQQPPPPNPMQIAEVENKKAQAAERQANAQDTSVDTQAKVLQLNAMMRNTMQPNSGLPPVTGQ
jgi:hypothetical protein